MILTKKLAELGVIMGLIGIGITVIYYFLGVQFMIKWWNGIIGIVLWIAMIIFFGRQYRKSIGGYISYWNAYVALLVILSVSAVLATLFNILLYHVIDPELPSKMHDAVVQSTVEWMEYFGVPQTEIEKAIDKMQQQQAEFTVGRQMLGIIWQFIWIAVFSLLMALFVKKNRPVVDETSLDQPPA